MCERMGLGASAVLVVIQIVHVVIVTSRHDMIKSSSPCESSGSVLPLYDGGGGAALPRADNEAPLPLLAADAVGVCLSSLTTSVNCALRFMRGRNGCAIHRARRTEVHAPSGIAHDWQRVNNVSGGCAATQR